MKDCVVTVVGLWIATGVGSAAVYKSFLHNFPHSNPKLKRWERSGVSEAVRRGGWARMSESTHPTPPASVAGLYGVPQKG